LTIALMPRLKTRIRCPINQTAPYDLANRIDGVRSVIILSLITAGLSTIVVWARIKDSKKD